MQSLPDGDLCRRRSRATIQTNKETWAVDTDTFFSFLVNIYCFSFRRRLYEEMNLSRPMSPNPLLGGPRQVTRMVGLLPCYFSEISQKHKQVYLDFTLLINLFSTWIYFLLLKIWIILFHFFTVLLFGEV